MPTSTHTSCHDGRAFSLELSKSHPGPGRLIDIADQFDAGQRSGKSVPQIRYLP